MDTERKLAEQVIALFRNERNKNFLEGYNQGIAVGQKIPPQIVNDPPPNI